MQYAGLTAGDRGGVLAAAKAETGSFHAIDFDPRVIEER